MKSKKPTRIVVSLNGGVVQDVFCTDPAAEVTLIDWDTQEADDGCPGLVEVGTDRADVRGYEASPWKSLQGTDCGDAMKAAGLWVNGPKEDKVMPKTKSKTLEVTLKIENLHDGSFGEDMLLGRLELFGGTHHVQFLKVHDVSMPESSAADKSLQQPTLDPHGHYEDLQKLYPANRYSTVRVPGFEGEYVMLVHPYED